MQIYQLFFSEDLVMIDNTLGECVERVKAWKEVNVGDSFLGAVDCFCYLGDSLSAACGCDATVIARCNCTRGNFLEIIPLLTARPLSFYVRGCLYCSVVKNSMLHAVET